MQADVPVTPVAEIVPVTRTAHRRRRSLVRSLAPLAGIAGLIVIWQIIVMMKVYPEFIIPTPLSVLNRFLEVLGDGRLAVHVGVTLGEIALGLTFGLSIAVVLGYGLAKSRLLDAVLSPLIVAVQAIPVVAYAPLLVIWFGTGTSSKVVTCALIVFFPMLMNTLVGIRDVPGSLQDLMRSLQATRWQMFTRLEIPAALPILFGGLKVSATLSVIGVVVGEFITADAGLGYLLKIARQAYDTPLVFVAVLTLALIARLLYGAVAILERRALHWKYRARSL